MPFKIIRNDITKMTVDVIVNPANNHLRKGGGVCGAIFDAAGEDKLGSECLSIGYCETGDCVITDSYNLPSKAMIHTVGPKWQGGNHNEELLLEGCYRKALTLAVDKGYESIAFPLISSGSYGYPKSLALSIAERTIKEFLDEHELMVYLVVYDHDSFSISEKRYTDIEKFIDDHYVDEHFMVRSNLSNYMESSTDACESNIRYSICQKKRSLDDVIANLDETFSEQLLRVIDEKGMTDVTTYKKANVDRRLFSKIRKKVDYNPSKTTAIALALALELSFDETQDLIGKAGYTLTRSNKFDVIIEFFINEENYDIFEINESLFAFDQVVLG